MDAVEFYDKWKGFPQQYAEFAADAMSVLATYAKARNNTMSRMSDDFQRNFCKWSYYLNWLVCDLDPCGLGKAKEEEGK